MGEGLPTAVIQPNNRPIMTEMMPGGSVDPEFHIEAVLRSSSLLITCLLSAHQNIIDKSHHEMQAPLQQPQPQLGPLAWDGRTLADSPHEYIVYLFGNEIKEIKMAAAFFEGPDRTYKPFRFTRARPLT